MTIESGPTRRVSGRLPMMYTPFGTAPQEVADEELVERRSDELADACMRTAEEIFQEHPFLEPAGAAQKLRCVIDGLMSPGGILGDPS